MSAQNTRCGVRGRRGVPRGWLSPLRRTLSRRRYGVWPTMVLPLQIATMALLCCCAFGLSCSFVANAQLISGSQVEYCVRDSFEPPNCSRKMIVEFTLESGKKAGAEEIHYLSSVIDNTERVSGQSPTKAIKNISLTLSRSRAHYVYPYAFAKNFYSSAKEEIKKGKLHAQCSNNPYSDKGTSCGTLYINDVRVEYSEGFCCDCSFCELSGLCEAESRGRRTCESASDFTSASCLRFGENIYGGYTVDPPYRWYTVHALLSLVDDPSQNATITLNPSRSVGRSDMFGASARLQGDFAPGISVRDFTHHLLFKPSLRSDLSRRRRKEKEWMLIEKHLVTMDGRECDKIGVSYEAFFRQGQRCLSNPGTCLANQLDDYRAADNQAEYEKRPTLYRVSSFGKFTKAKQLNKSGTTECLAYEDPDPPKALVTVILDADKLRYILSVSPGKISQAYMIGNTTIVLRGASVMNITVSNSGTLTAAFTVSVTNCSEGILDIPDRSLTINPKDNVSTYFNVYANAYPPTGEALCIVRLYNAEYKLVSQENLTWNVIALNDNATVINGGRYVAPYYPGSTPNAACTDCSFANVWCAFRDDCPTFLRTDIGIICIVLLLVAIISYVFYLTKGICFQVLFFFCCGCPSGSTAPGAASGASKAVASTAPAAQQVQSEMCLGASTEQHTTAPLYDYYSDTTRATLSEPYAVPPAVHADSPSPCRCSGADAHSLPAATVPAHSSSADQLHTVARATETDSDHEPDQYHDGPGGSSTADQNHGPYISVADMERYVLHLIRKVTSKTDAAVQP